MSLVPRVTTMTNTVFTHSISPNVNMGITHNEIGQFLSFSGVTQQCFASLCH